MSSEMLPAERLENALGKLQDAQSALKLAAEELAASRMPWCWFVPFVLTMATRVAALLNGNDVWTEDRPTEPGEYWLSLKPSSRAGILPTKGYPLAVTMFLHSGDLCVGINGVAFGMEARCFDGAKWSRRETPADPFEEVAT